MVPGLTTIIIPTFEHAASLGDAIDCALHQTAPVEVIVVDDGSTDSTPAVLERYGGRIRPFRIEHAGPSAARNVGLDEARGEFVQFLDADDVIVPSKIERQLAAMAPPVGWVLCDVLIEDERPKRSLLASERYEYRRVAPTGWLAKRLAARNIVPIHSPIVRRSVIGDIRFDGRQPEDWYFWQAVAAEARAAYVPEVLATYRRGKRGQHALRVAQAGVAGSAGNPVVPPLRLNLGCGTQGKASWHPIEGMVNLDKSLGWCFEDGLGAFRDHSVAGITVSHSLYLVPLAAWPKVFGEFARVLANDGVIRISEDDAINPRSARRGGWKGSEPCVTLTSARLVLDMLESVGLTACEVDAQTTGFCDRSLLQQHHGAPPDVFFVEGRRERTVLFSPHNDDEALFAAFAVLKYRPRVVVCYPSVRDYGDPAVREAESRAALEILGAAGVEQWAGIDILAHMRSFDARFRPSRVWAPHPRASHPEHVAVAEAAAYVFGDRVRRYHTYDAAGKVRAGRRVVPAPGWMSAKFRALACYQTQIDHPRAGAFFVEDPAEYVEEGNR